jgi:hypothetical protein
VLARTEAESAREETSLARELAASQAEEDVAAAAGAWPRRPLARCWRPPLCGGPFARVTVRGRARFCRGWKQRARVLLLPLPMPEPAGTVCL